MIRRSRASSSSPEVHLTNKLENKCHDYPTSAKKRPKKPALPIKLHKLQFIEILKQGKVDAATMDDEKKRETVENYIAFKNLMFKIDKDEDEYDDDGNLIPNHPQVQSDSRRDKY